MWESRGLNEVRGSIEKSKSINNFLSVNSVATASIVLIQDKTAISYTSDGVGLKRLNRGSLKNKYDNSDSIDTESYRELDLLRSVGVRKVLTERAKGIKNKDKLETALISMNRLCEELSLFKNMRKASNVWTKNLLQVRFTVRNDKNNSSLIGVLDCMESFLNNLDKLNLNDRMVMSKLESDLEEYTESCKYITEWLIYANLLDIICNMLSKGYKNYTTLLEKLPTKDNTKRFEMFANKLHNLDEVSIMLFLELLKTTQNLDVKENGKQKKKVLERIFPFDLNDAEFEAHTGLHTNVLKMIVLLVNYIDEDSFDKVELIDYYMLLLKDLTNELSNDHITEDLFDYHRSKILNFHKTYGVSISKVKTYGKNDEIGGYTKIVDTENMEFIAYRELWGNLSDMQKSLYSMQLDLKK